MSIVQTTAGTFGINGSLNVQNTLTATEVDLTTLKVGGVDVTSAISADAATATTVANIISGSQKVGDAIKSDTSVIASTSTTATDYLTFTSGQTGNLALYTSPNISIDPLGSLTIKNNLNANTLLLGTGVLGYVLIDGSAANAYNLTASNLASLDTTTSIATQFSNLPSTYALKTAVVDLTTDQTVVGKKTFSSAATFSSGLTGSLTGNASSSNSVFVNVPGSGTYSLIACPNGSNGPGVSVDTTNCTYNATTQVLTAPSITCSGAFSCGSETDLGTLTVSGLLTANGNITTGTLNAGYISGIANQTIINAGNIYIGTGAGGSVQLTGSVTYNPLNSQAGIRYQPFSYGGVFNVNAATQTLVSGAIFNEWYHLNVTYTSTTPILKIPDPASFQIGQTIKFIRCGVTANNAVILQTVTSASSNFLINASATDISPSFQLGSSWYKIGFVCLPNPDATGSPNCWQQIMYQ